MSGLAGLLAGYDAPGVRLWASAQPVEGIAHTVEHAGWNFGWIDGWTRPGKAGVLAALGEALHFPAHYGHNLDALADCLSDLEHDTLVLWDGWSVLAAEDPRACTGVLQVLTEAATTARTHRFAVLLRGEGPAILDLPTLE